MPDQSAATPIRQGYVAPRRPMSVDEAVRAVLSFRAAESRSFGNEDDLEGPRPSAPDIRKAPPVG